MSAPQPGLRAFDIFDHVPANHRLHLMPDTRLEPHIHEGEFAVIDLTDREIIFGECYSVMQSKGPVIWQILVPPPFYGPQGERPAGYLAPLNHPTADLNPSRSYGHLHLSDGPRYLDILEREIVGRVVGIFQAPR
jgi:hypothetical protein